MFINDLGMKEVDRVEAESLGIDLSMVRVCKKLRNLAKLDRLRIDETVHRSGLNKHLFSYIEYCGLTPLEFVKEYLSNLQPFMLERRKDQEADNRFICVIDNVYRVSVYIKADNTQFDEAIISFHEDNIRGVAKDNSVMTYDTEKYVPVFSEGYGSINEENGNVSLKVMCQRGMKVLPLTLIGFKCEDVFIVRYRDIARQFIEYCNQYIRDLYTSNLKLDYEKIEVFTMLQQISFTSYGKDTFSSVSLLIDSLTIQNDGNSRQAADFALVTFVQSLKLTSEQRNELFSLILEKYSVTSIKSIDTILYRIQDALEIGS